MKIRGNFLVVHIRMTEWRRGLFFPFPLFLVEDALASAAVLVRAAVWIRRRFPHFAPSLGFSDQSFGATWDSPRAGGARRFGGRYGAGSDAKHHTDFVDDFDDHFDAGFGQCGAGRAVGTLFRFVGGPRWARLERFVYLPAALIGALRSCGRFTLVDVRAEDAHVSVRVV